MPPTIPTMTTTPAPLPMLWNAWDVPCASPPCISDQSDRPETSR